MNEELLKPIKILVVDDEIELRKIIELRYKNNPDYDLLFAEDGEKGLKLYYDCNPDIIVSDIKMSKMNGIEFSKKIRENNKIIPIIILTSYSDKEVLLDLINLNIDAYLLKINIIKDLPLTIDKYANEIFDKRKLLQFENEKNKLLEQLKEKEKNLIKYTSFLYSFLNAIPLPNFFK